LELNSVLEWVGWVVVSLSVNVPSLVSAIVAFVPDDMSVLGVRVSVNVKTSLSDISNVSSRSSVPSHLLESLVSVRSNNSSDTLLVPVPVVVLDGDQHVSVSSRSDRLGS